MLQLSVRFQCRSVVGLYKSLTSFGPTLVPSSLLPPPSSLPPPGYKACSGHIAGGVPTVCTPFCYSSRADPTTLRAVPTTATAAVAGPAETPRCRTLRLRLGRARAQTPGLSRNATISVSVSTGRPEFCSRSVSRSEFRSSSRSWSRFRLV